MPRAIDRGGTHHAGPVALFGLLAVIWSFPLVLELDQTIPGNGPGDNLTFLWNFWWMRHVLEHSELRYFHSDYLFAPSGIDLTLHTHTALPALISATVLRPFSLPVAHNLVILLTLFLNAAAAYFLSWNITRSRAGALVAGLIFGGSPYIMAHLHGHLNLVSAWGLPAFSLFLLRTLDNRSTRSALAAGVCLVAIGYTDYYYLVFAAAFSLAWLTIRFVRLSLTWGTPSARRLRASGAVLGLLIADLLVAAVIIMTGGFTTSVFGVPISAQGIANELTTGWLFLLLWAWLRYAPVLSADWQSTGRLSHDLRVLLPGLGLAVVGLSPLAVQGIVLWSSGGYAGQAFLWRSAPQGIDALAPLLGNPYHPLSGGIITSIYALFDLDRIEAVGWIGVVPAYLLWRVLRRTESYRTARPWLIAGTVFFVWSLGPFLTVAGKNVGLILPQTFLRALPVISNARMPGRAMVMVYLALSVIAAIGIAHMNRSRARTVMLLALGTVAVFDYLAAPFPLYRLDRPAIYETLDQLPGQGVVCELPFGIRDGFGEKGQLDHRILFYQSIHQRPIIGGFAARLPPSVENNYMRIPVIDTLMRLSAGERLEARDARAPSDVIADLRASSIRWVVLNRQTAPPDLVRYVESVLPLQLIEEQDERALYAVTP